MALKDFKVSLSRAKSLLDLEISLYNDPPKVNERDKVAALRGGASVLLVAALEKYFRDVFEELIDEVVGHPKYNFGKLPETMQLHGISEMLNWAIKGEPYAPIRDKAQKIIDMLATSSKVHARSLDARVYANTKSNPDSDTIKFMTKSINIKDYFGTIKPRFDTKLGHATSHTYIPDTLDSIIQRRHIVAHTATATNITRQDLKESIRFLRIFCEVTDMEIKKKAREIKRSF